jgi:8-oxo-dGTP pyrophosphatase MutT (NUDIX family)
VDVEVIRLRPSAAVVRDGHLLVIEYDDPTVEPAFRVHFNLPGGGASPGETLAQALIREVREEAAAEIEVGRLLLVWEFHFAMEYPGLGVLPSRVVHFVFECTLQPGSEPHMPDVPDPYQVGVRWVPLDGFAEAPPLLPDYAGQIRQALATGSSVPVCVEVRETPRA